MGILEWNCPRIPCPALLAMQYYQHCAAETQTVRCCGHYNPCIVAGLVINLKEMAIYQRNCNVWVTEYQACIILRTIFIPVIIIQIIFICIGSMKMCQN